MATRGECGEQEGDGEGGRRLETISVGYRR